MTVLRHKTPCKQCPFRQESLPGWLGNSTAEEFVGNTLGGVHMPCHLTVNYEKPNWEEQLLDAAQCVGSLIFLRNCGSQGEYALQNDDRLVAMQQECAPKADYINVLVGPGHFVAHHTKTLKRPA